MKFTLVLLSAVLIPVLAPFELYTPLFVMLSCMLAGILGISLVYGGEDRGFLYKIFVGGYLLRVFGSVFLNLMTCARPRFPGFFIADSWVYSANAVRVAERLQHGLPVIGIPRSELWSYSGGMHYYDYLNGGIYFFLGSRPLIMFFLNSFFGILAAVFVYFIALAVSGRKAARLAAGLCAFWPSLFLWSTQNLKEPLTVLCVVLCLWGFVFFVKKANPFYLAAVFLSLRLLAVFRPPVDRIVLAAFVLHVIFLAFYALRRRPFLIILAIPLFMLIGSGFNQFTNRFIELLASPGALVSSTIEMINNLRSARTTAELAFLPGYEILNLKSLLFYMPAGISVVLFAPFPWQVFSASQIMALPEMLVWYMMLPFVFKGMYTCIRSKATYAASVAAYTIIMLLLLSFIEGNIGTMFRHRSIVLIFLLMFMAVGRETTPEKRVQYAK